MHLWREPPASLIGKVSQIVIDNLSMTEGDAKKSTPNLLTKSSIIMAKNEKGFSTFVPFESKEAQEILAAKQAAEFPQLTTATGKCQLQRLIKWESITYRGREMDIPVIAAKVGSQQKQVTLSTLFGKEHTFVIDRESGDYKKGARYQINNLVEWTPELQSVTSARNAAVMAAVTDNLEITLLTLWGHFEGGQGRSFNLTFVEGGAVKL